MMMDEKMRQDRIRSEAERRFAQQSPRARIAPPGEALSRWLEESPAHADAYAATGATWERLDALQDDPDMQALKARTQARLEARQRARATRGPWRAMALAAGLAGCAIAGMVAWRWSQPVLPPTITFATAIGEQRNATLQDGSEVTLNTGTMLEARIGDDMRQLVLQHGEALFKVRHDRSRPFVVHAGAGTITALGTQFQVRHYEHQSTVTLLEGSVEVRDGQGGSVVLQPLQQARFDDSGMSIEVHAVDQEVATGWTRGWLIFRKQPLAEVVAEVNLYSAHKLRLGDPSLARLSINGNFRIGDSASIAGALAALLPIKVDDDGAELVLRPKATPAPSRQ